MSTTTAAATIVTGHFGFAEKHQLSGSDHQLLRSTQSYQPNDLICSFGSGEIHRHPSKYTVQVAENKHIILHPEFLQYINHSCNPNVFFNTATMELIALQPIKPGDEFTFFYPSTEWFMAEPFNCLCGETNCIGVIKGAKELSKDLLSKYRLTDFIQSKINQLKD
jgi:hypothetical protein